MGGALKLAVRHVDADTLYRQADVSIAGRPFKTPLKALDIARFGNVPLPSRGPSINEAYRAFKVADLARGMRDTTAHDQLTAPLRRAKFAGDAHDALTMPLLQLDEPITAPHMLEYVEGIVYAHADIVTVPLVARLHKRVQGRDELFQSYVAFVKAFLDEVAKLNKKPVLGSMPPLPWLLSKELAEIYLEAGVDGFLIDFAGHTPSVAESQGLRQLLKRLKEEDLVEKQLLYAVNANTGRVAAKPLGPGVVAAKDILSFGFNIDVLGLKHIPLKGPKELYEKLDKQEPLVRIFNRAKYAYDDIRPLDAAKVLPADTKVPVAMLRTKSTQNRAKHLLNMEQQAVEARVLQRVITEDGVAKYLGAKAAFEPGDLGRFKAAKSDLRTKQMSLGSDWGL